MFDGSVSCNRVNGVSVSATPPLYRLLLHCVTSARAPTLCVTDTFVLIEVFKEA